MPGERLIGITGRAIGMAQLIVGRSDPVIAEIGFKTGPAALGLRPVLCHLITDAAHGEDGRGGGLLARHGPTLSEKVSATYWAFP